MESLSQYYDEEMPEPDLTNKGRRHEQIMYELYRNKGLIPQGFMPPQKGGHGVDLKLFVKNYTINQAVKRIANIATLGGGEDIGSVVGVELKLTTGTLKTVDFAQSALTYIYAQKNWAFTGKDEPENIENRRLLTLANVLQVINSKWDSKKNEPKRFRYKSGTPKSLPAEAKQHDKDMFDDTKVNMSAIPNVCAAYYTAKQCNYINISSHGLYYLNSDPLGLQMKYGVKRFGSSVSSMGIRFRPKVGGSFGFEVAMKITGTLTESPVNLIDETFANQLRDDAMMCRNTTYALSEYKKRNG